MEFSSVVSGALIHTYIHIHKIMKERRGVNFVSARVVALCLSCFMAGRFLRLPGLPETGVGVRLGVHSIHFGIYMMKVYSL